MPATPILPRAVFWGHVLVALVIAAVAVALWRLVPALDLEPGGAEVAGLTRMGLERALPAGGGLLALSTLGFGLNYLAGEVSALDPRTSELNTVENVALLVPGKAVGDLAGLAGVALINAALALFVLDLLYRWARS